MTLVRKSSTEKDMPTLVKEMRRSSTARDVTTLVKGSSEATSLTARRYSSRLHERRKSLPTEDLHDDIQRLNIVRNKSKTYSHHSRSNSSKTQYMIKHTKIKYSITGSVDTPSDVGLVALTVNTDRSKFFPSFSTGSPFESGLEDSHGIPMNRNSSGEINAIKQIRQTLGRTIQPTTAWSSLSRTSSKTASFTNSRSSSRPSSQYDIDSEADELMVSYPNNHQFPRRDTEDNADHTRLPTISQPPQYAKRRNNSSKRLKHKRSSPDGYELQSDLLPEAFFSEVLRVLSNIKLLEFEARNSSMIACQFKGARFYITVNHGGRGKFHVLFEWISGGNDKYYSEIRDHILSTLVL